MSIALKARFEGEVRRLTLNSENPSFESLKQTVTKLFQLNQENFGITYVDDEKDNVTISTDEELQEAIRTLRGALLTINVSKPQQKVTEQPQPTKKCKFFEHLGLCDSTDAQSDTNTNGCHLGKRRRCHRIFFGVVFGIVAFKFFAFLASHFFCLALLILSVGAAKILIKRYRTRCNAAGPFTCIFGKADKQAASSGPIAVPQQTQVSLPAAAAAVAPFNDQEEGERPKNKLLQMLQLLEDIGFTDRQLNVAFMVQHNFDLNKAIASLIATKVKKTSAN